MTFVWGGRPGILWGEDMTHTELQELLMAAYLEGVEEGVRSGDSTVLAPGVVVPCQGDVIWFRDQGRLIPIGVTENVLVEVFYDQLDVTMFHSTRQFARGLCRTKIVVDVIQNGNMP